jgi:putative ABC transport system substrate-binding protein
MPERVWNQVWRAGAGIALAVTLASPSEPSAQPARMPRIGVLANTIPTADLVAGTSTHPAITQLLEGLRERGWMPGKNVELVWRSAEGDYTRHPQQARELAEACDLIVVYGPGIDAAMGATNTVPIVMATSGLTFPPLKDKKGDVRIASFARPGGNITGLTLVSGGGELNGKRLELLKAIAPQIKRVAILGHDLPHAKAHVGPRTAKAAERLSLELATYSFNSAIEKLPAVFEEMSRDAVQAVIVTELPATNLLPVQKEIHRLAERHRIVAMHEVLSAVDSGGLMAYGHDIHLLYRRAGHFVDRILRGTKPGDIPIEQPTEFELRLNERAARAIGITLPQSLRVQARRVVD